MQSLFVSRFAFILKVQNTNKIATHSCNTHAIFHNLFIIFEINKQIVTYKNKISCVYIIRPSRYSLVFQVILILPITATSALDRPRVFPMFIVGIFDTEQSEESGQCCREDNII